MKKISSKIIKNKLDNWVSKVGTGKYQPNNYVDDIDNTFSLSENFGIQQVKTEIYQFIDILLKQKKAKNCLLKKRTVKMSFIFMLYTIQKEILLLRN